MKDRIRKILVAIGIKAKIRKAANEEAVWIYPATMLGGHFCSGFILTQEDLQYSDDYLREYIKCVCDMDFDAKVWQ